MLKFLRVLLFIVLPFLSVFGYEDMLNADISKKIESKETTREKSERKCDSKFSKSTAILREHSIKSRAAFNGAARLLRTCQCEKDSQQFSTLKNFLDAHPEIISFANPLGETLLIIAAKYNREFPLELLIQRGADVDAQDKSGNSALLAAIRKDHLNSVVLLLYFGAKTHIRNKEGFNAYQLACTLPNINVLGVLYKIKDILPHGNCRSWIVSPYVP